MTPVVQFQGLKEFSAHQKWLLLLDESGSLLGTIFGLPSSIH